MLSDRDILLICQVGMGLFWIFTYILVIYKGWQDKSYGMPMVLFVPIFHGNLSLPFSTHKMTSNAILR